MRQRSSLALIALLISCHPAPSPQSEPQSTARTTTQPRFAATAHARRVVLLSFDGLSADLVESNLPASFRRFSSEGTVVRRVIPVNPTATSPTHASIFTGAPPDKTGVIANRFHKRGTPPNEVAEGLATEIEAETLIDAARKSGKRVGSIAFPSVDATTPRRAADFGVVYTRLTRSQVIELSRDDFHSDWLPPEWGGSAPRRPSFSPILRARLTWTVPQRTSVNADLVAYDTTDDHARNYDTFAVETPDAEVEVKDGWFPIAQKLDDGLWGSWSKILHADASLQSVTLYWGGITHTVAYPESFRTMLDDELGFWPGPPDDASAANWLEKKPGLDPDSFAEQAERLSQFMTAATTLAIARMPFDLLLAYQPIVDQSEHQFRITLDTQRNATAENRASGERVRGRAWAVADRAAGAIAGALDLREDALVVTGDHGLAAVDTEVRLGTFLQSAGLSPWTAYASGNVAHFYRFGGSDDTAAVITTLKTLAGPDGSPVFEQVARKAAGAHLNAGDIVAYAFPRFVLSAGTGPLFVAPAVYAQHGGLNTHHEFHTFLGALGAGVPTVVIEQIRQTQIARFVSALVGMDPPSTAE